LENTMSKQVIEQAAVGLNETESAILGVELMDQESVLENGSPAAEKNQEEITEEDEEKSKINPDFQGGESDEEAEPELKGSGDDSEEEGSDEVDPQSGLSVKVQKRIDKITAEKGDLKTKLAEREAEIISLKQKLDSAGGDKLVLSPSAMSPLANVMTEAELDQRVVQAKRVKRWALENINGVVVNGENGAEDREYTEREVRQIMANADELLTEAVPARRQYLKDQAAWDAQTRAVYPDLFDGGSELYKEAKEYLKAMPELMRYPDWKVCIGDFIEGRKARMKREAAAKTTEEPKTVAKPLVKSKAAVAPKVPEPAPRPVVSGKGNSAALNQARVNVQKGVASLEDQNALIGSFL
jgi:hypothetical protein